MASTPPHQDSPQRESQEWWQAVRSIADLVSRDGLQLDEEKIIREQLAGRGFSERGIGEALDWVGMASLSGNLLDTLSMLSPVSDAVRTPHVLEEASLSPGVRRAVETCRRAGVLSPEAAERLIEGLRVMDTRDWEREEIESFFSEMLTVSATGLTSESVSHILRGKSREHFN